MLKMLRSIRQTAMSPWFLAPLSFGLGASVALAIVGIPRLWTAEAAGWGATFATFSATVAALWIASRANRQDAARRRHMDAIARAKVAVIATRAFDELEMLGNSPGIAGGTWDNSTVSFSFVCAKRLLAACNEMDVVSKDLKEDSALVFVGFSAKCAAIVSQITELERNDEEHRYRIADYVTHGIYERAHALVKNENEVMSAIGMRQTSVRMQLGKVDRPLGIVVGAPGDPDPIV